jgi:hypothetical protein
MEEKDRELTAETRWIRHRESAIEALLFVETVILALSLLPK